MFCGNQVVLLAVGTLGVVMHHGDTDHGNKAMIIFSLVFICFGNMLSNMNLLLMLVSCCYS